MFFEVEIDMARALVGEGLNERIEELAQLLMDQTLDRIEEGGDDDIKFEPLKFDRPTGDRDRPLFSTGANLHQSITKGVDHDGAWVGSTFEGGPVHQWGTKGAQAEGVGQGKLDTIRPKKAKALFIPTSPRAAKSVRILTPSPRGPRPLRVFRGKGGEEDVMKKGKDFIFVSKVDVPPRPFLRVSRRNLEEITQLFADGESPR